MVRDKAHLFQMRVSSEWLARVDAWRRTQPDLPPRAEAVRRLVGMGLRFGLVAGDKVSTPAGPATVTHVAAAIGHVEVKTKNGDGHAFMLSQVEALN